MAYKLANAMADLDMSLYAFLFVRIAVSKIAWIALWSLRLTSQPMFFSCKFCQGVLSEIITGSPTDKASKMACPKFSPSESSINNHTQKVFCEPYRYAKFPYN